MKLKDDKEQQNKADSSLEENESSSLLNMLPIKLIKSLKYFIQPPYWISTAYQFWQVKTHLIVSNGYQLSQKTCQMCRHNTNTWVYNYTWIEGTSVLIFEKYVVGLILLLFASLCDQKCSHCPLKFSHFPANELPSYLPPTYTYIHLTIVTILHHRTYVDKLYFFKSFRYFARLRIKKTWLKDRTILHCKSLLTRLFSFTFLCYSNHYVCTQNKKTLPNCLCLSRSRMIWIYFVTKCLPMLCQIYIFPQVSNFYLAEMRTHICKQ